MMTPWGHCSSPGCLRLDFLLNEKKEPYLVYTGVRRALAKNMS